MKARFHAVFYAIAAVALLSLAEVAKAQTAPSPATGAWQPPPPEQVTNWLAGKLNLSDDQKNQITPIIADRQQKLAAIRADTTLRRGQKLRQMKSVYDDSDARIEAVLSDAQKQQYAALKAQMRQQFQERMQQRRAASSGG